MVLQQTLSLDDKLQAWPDTRLVRECLEGNEEAWAALIDKYNSLIFSIPIKYGFSTDDATDVFQAVCVELLSELPNLRKPKALPKWIIQVTNHKCFHRKRQQQRTESLDADHVPINDTVPARAEAILRQAEEEQNLQQAISELPQRCQQLVQMLFFEEPAREYREVAEILGIATGSVGFIRQRCLERLRKRLSQLGLE